MKKPLLILSIALIAFLSACGLTAPQTTTTTASTALPVSTDGVTTTVLDYAGFTHLAGYDEIFDRSTSTYIVYLYSLSCHNCNAIKQQVYDFASTHATHPLYFLNVEGIDSDGREMYLQLTGQSSVGVPCMILVSEQGSFDPEATGAHLARGSSAVLELIARIEADNVPHWS